jgi:uncharacterized protein YecE (DUF72 family)
VSPARIGTAAWSLPKGLADRFPAAGSHLERYAARFDAVEINSSFYRPHRAQTYRRWAEATPASFQFAVKAPKVLTHERRLADPEVPLAAFLDQVECLGDKLGPILVQSPPSLRFDAGVAEAFFATLRARFGGLVAFEPRHASWFEPDAEGLLRDHRIARVAADPPPVPAAASVGGWPGLAYHRLHGSPRIYYSEYGDARLATFAGALNPNAAQTWVIFDNTALGAATKDALALQARLHCGAGLASTEHYLLSSSSNEGPSNV